MTIVSTPQRKVADARWSTPVLRGSDGEAVDPRHRSRAPPEQSGRLKLGKTLVPARSMDESKFTKGDRREVVTIALPRADRAYKIVSRHDAGLIEVAKKEKDGSFRGQSIKIVDPARFWASSRYLIIAEK